MYQVEDEPIETIHVYVVREGQQRPSIAPVIISLLALSILIAIGVLTPSPQPEQRASLRVPAVPLFTETFSTPIKVTPTGLKTYPATFAHGALTITNGSVIAQTLPAGFTAVSGSGVSVVTDAAVFVPAGNANGYGIATVAAHGLTAGVNLPTLAINQVVGTSLYVRNLEPLTGGHAAYSVRFVTPQDRVRAIAQARVLVAAQVTGLHYPCRETITTMLSWHCPFVTYSIPSYMHVISARLQGKEVVVAVWFVARPQLFWAK